MLNRIPRITWWQDHERHEHEEEEADPLASAQATNQMLLPSHTLGLWVVQVVKRFHSAKVELLSSDK